ncbi:MAG: glucosaminidase domain-containing protein [Bacteroidales bacterium]|nr:glucosaminidase domain-containing protein [Bacteroidales bacterium]
MRKVRIIVLAVVCIAGVLAFAQQKPRGNSPQERYIYTYSDIAVAEMQRTGVPASITLAQGIIESGSGLSKLAVDGNNHFGIKCHNSWKGGTMNVDDDRKGECFRTYETPEESFRDHSDFLRYRDRYKFLFDLDRRDYKGWAFGLKQAGYATDPSYASKLIRTIEEYDLSRFDFLTNEELSTLPASPTRLEEPVAVRNSAPAPVQEEFRFSLSRVLYTLNDVAFVYAKENDTFRSIAKEHHLFFFEILRFNDVKKDAVVTPGEVVYLEAKKNKAPKGLDMYIVSEDGESFHHICQRFAVKESAIRMLNRLDSNPQLFEGDVIKLR